MTPDHVAEVVQGRWTNRGESRNPITGAAIDTREIEPENVFFAFRGEHTDGHRFLRAAAERGAAFAVVADPDAIAGDTPSTFGVLLVGDVERALVDLAGARRNALGTTRVVAITGSAGKTTTARLLGQVLEGPLRGVCARKSHNNRLGISMTIARVEPSDDYLVCEVGTSSPGEIAEYASLVRPHIGVVTSFGREHLEGFGDLDGVAEEAAALFDRIEPGGVAIVDSAAAPVIERAPRSLELITVGAGSDADVRVDDIVTTWDRTTFALGGCSFSVALPGRHNAHNAAIAITVARRLGLDDAAVASGLGSARGPEMRFERTEVAGVRVINDAYNAHPDSMLASLETFAEMDPCGARRVVVLGDMLELGDHSAAAHREIADRIIELNTADLVVAVGEGMELLADRIRGTTEVVHLPDLGGDRADRAADLINPGDLVLLKGSRGMRLERVVESLKAREGARAHPSR